MVAFSVSLSNPNCLYKQTCQRLPVLRDCINSYVSTKVSRKVKALKQTIKCFILEHVLTVQSQAHVFISVY